MSRVILLPVVAFLAALLGTAAVRAVGDSASLPASHEAQMPAPSESTPESAPPKLAKVRDLPAPVGTREPTLARRAPTPGNALAPSATSTPVGAAPTPVAAPAPAPPPASVPSAPTPAPTFDDPGTGPVFDDDGTSP